MYQLGLKESEIVQNRKGLRVPFTQSRMGRKKAGETFKREKYMEKERWLGGRNKKPRPKAMDYGESFSGKEQFKELQISDQLDFIIAMDQ